MPPRKTKRPLNKYQKFVKKLAKDTGHLLSRKKLLKVAGRMWREEKK